MRKYPDTDIGDILIDLAPQERGTPERSLLQALLLDAWSCCLTASRGRRARHIAHEAMHWVEGATSGPFTFEAVCEYLGLDSRELRRRFRDLNKSRPARKLRVQAKITRHFGDRKIG